jgi:hypothetical protein
MMRGRARLWSAAVLASVLAHGGLLVLLALAVDPASPVPQETVQTRFAISTQTVESLAAPLAPSMAERPDTRPAEGTRMDDAAVPVSRVRPAAFRAPAATGIAATGTALAPSAAQGAQVAAAGTRADMVMAPVAPDAAADVAAAPADLVPEVVVPLSPAGEALQLAVAPAPVPARPRAPSPVPAQAQDGGAARAAALPAGGVSAKVVAVEGIRAGAAVTPGDRAEAVSAAGRAAVSVPVPESAAVPTAAPRPLTVTAVAPVGVRAAYALQPAPGAAARSAPRRAETGAAIPVTGLSGSAPSAPPRAETAAAADADLAAAPAPLASGAGQALDARAPAGTATVPLGADRLARPVPQSTPETARVTAALAWSGAAGGATVDPVSLAAIQSFLRPGDSDQGATTVRDGISGVLASVPCARLQTAFLPETGQLELRGHIPEESLRAPVLAALRAQVGTSIPLADNILVLPRPTCGALSGIASVGLAQSREQTRDPRIVGPDAHARVYRFVDGDRLSFELTGPDYPAYFYIDYFDAGGMVLHLQPNEIVPLARIGAKERLVVGQGAQGQPVQDIRVSPPFGQEIMVAFATSVPLYDGLRPVRERAGPYLDFLRWRVAQARAAHPDFRGEWVYFFVSTRAR